MKMKKWSKLFRDCRCLVEIILLLANPVRREEKFSADKRVRIELSSIESALSSEFGSETAELILGHKPNKLYYLLRDHLGFKVANSGGKRIVYFTIPELLQKHKEYEGMEESRKPWEKWIQDSEKL